MTQTSQTEKAKALINKLLADRAMEGVMLKEEVRRQDNWSKTVKPSGIGGRPGVDPGFRDIDLGTRSRPPAQPGFNITLKQKSYLINLLKKYRLAWAWIEDDMPRRRASVCIDILSNAAKNSTPKSQVVTELLDAGFDDAC